MVEGARASCRKAIEGMVNWPRNVDWLMQVGVLLTTAKGGGVRVSMPVAQQRIDVGKVCMTLGSGGHPGARWLPHQRRSRRDQGKVVRALDQAFNRPRGAHISGQVP